MKNLRVKIAALFTAGMSIFPNVSFNVVKANDILKKDTFVENFQKKNIPVYRTENNLLVDASLNYINEEGKLLSEKDSKVSISDELNNELDLHPVLRYIDNNKDAFIFTKSQFSDGRSHIFVKKNKDAKLKMLYFDPEIEVVGYTGTIMSLVQPGVVNEFGAALPALEENESSEKNNLIAELQSQVNSISKNKEANHKQKDNTDSYIAAAVTAITVLAGIYGISQFLSAQNEVDCDLD